MIEAAVPAGAGIEVVAVAFVVGASMVDMGFGVDSEVFRTAATKLHMQLLG